VVNNFLQLLALLAFSVLEKIMFSLRLDILKFPITFDAGRAKGAIA